MHKNSVKAIVNWEPKYISTCDVLYIRNSAGEENFYIITKILRQYTTNSEYDPIYVTNMKKYQKSKQKKKNMRYSKKKVNKKTINIFVQLKQLNMVNDVWYFDESVHEVQLNKLLIKKSFVYQNLKELLKDFIINKEFIYKNEELIESNITIDILNKLDKEFQKYSPYNTNCIPVNVALYADDLSMNVNKKTSYGVLRMKYLDGDRYVNNKLANIPIIFVYPKKCDKISLMKVICELFKELVTETFWYKSSKFQVQICALIMDSQERVLWSNINCSNATINPCSICNVETIDVLTKYQTNYDFKVDDLSDELTDNDLVYGSDDDDFDIKQEYSSDNQDTTDIECSMSDISDLFVDEFDLDNWEDFPMYINNFWCTGNWGWYQICQLKSTISNVKLSEYSFVYPHINVLYRKFIRKIDINKLFVNDIGHSFSNMSKQIIAEISQLCNKNEYQLLETQIIRFSLISEYDPNKLVQHENIMILEKISIIMYTFGIHYPNHILSKHLIYWSYISIYVMIVEYDDPHDYPFIKIGFIVYNFLRFLSDLVQQKNKKSAITAVTLHQFVPFTITTLYCYRSLKIYNTSPMERGMSEIRQLLNKSFNKTINQCIINILLRRNMYRLFTAKFNFKLNDRLNCPYRYLWDPKGNLHVSPDLLSLKNRKLYMDCNDYLFLKQKIGQKFIENIDGTKYYGKLKINEFANVINTTSYYKRLKYYPNNWLVNKYYIIRFDEEHIYLGELIKIYTLDDQIFWGDFVLFQEFKDLAPNGYFQYKKSQEILDKVVLNTPPHCCELYHIAGKYFLHPVYFQQRRESVYLTQMWNCISEL